MSQIVFNVPAMLLVLVLMTLAGSPSSMTYNYTGCLATDDNEVAHSWAWLQQLVQRAQHGVARCALFRALPRAKRANGDVSLRDHDRAAAPAAA